MIKVGILASEIYDHLYTSFYPSIYFILSFIGILHDRYINLSSLVSFKCQPTWNHLRGEVQLKNCVNHVVL